MGKVVGKKRKFTVPPHLATLHRQLQETSGVMMRQFLWYEGLDAPSSVSTEQFATRVIQYLDEGSLSEASVRRFLVDSLEHGSKHAFLFQVDPSRLREWRNRTHTTATRSLDGVAIHRSPREPHVNYLYVGSEAIRASYAEMHEDLSIDPETERVVRQDRLCVAVVHVDRVAGAATVLIDEPGNANPHGGRMQYFNHYVGALSLLLGDGPASPLDLSEALRRMQEDERIRIPFTRMETAENKVSIQSTTNPDLRKSKDWSLVKARRTGYDEDEFVWLPQGNHTTGEVSVPLREIRTRIYAPTGHVKFTKHTLGCEVEYVLGVLRENA